MNNKKCVDKINSTYYVYTEDAKDIEKTLTVLRGKSIENNDEDAADVIAKAQIYAVYKLYDELDEKIDKIIDEYNKPLVDFIEAHGGKVYYSNGEIKVCEKEIILDAYKKA